MLQFLNNETFRRRTVLVCRIILGCVFIFSGFAKAIDPLGGLYKVEDYLVAFGWDFLIPLAFIGSTLLSIAEFVLGVALLFGLRLKWTAICTLLFMAVMTPLTLYIAIYNPVTDCGCFGEALKISNWETFWKNVVFSVMAVIVYLWRDSDNSKYSLSTEIGIVAYSFVFMCFTSYYCLENLPIIDFRPYKIGTNMPEAMAIPEDAKPDVYETKFIYEKDGQQKEFTLENYPKGDTAWKHVETISELVEKGYEPPIHDFTMDDIDMGDLTEDVLADPNYSFLVVCSKIDKTDTAFSQKVNDAYQFAQNNGYGFYCLTNTGLESEELENFKTKYNAEYKFVNTDEITLKTIVRSNPGMVLIKEGVVINKWSAKNIPTFEEPLEASEHGKLVVANDWLTAFVFFFIFFLPIGLFFGAKRFVCKK